MEGVRGLGPTKSHMRTYFPNTYKFCYDFQWKKRIGSGGLEGMLFEGSEIG